MPHKIKKHHKTNHAKHYLKPYLPYLPLFAAIAIGLAYGHPWKAPSNDYQKGVLAYSTNISHAGLLQETNDKRLGIGRTTLSLNSTLNQAAQAKANDMATRNYWSHNTPEGSTPWIFITQAGYKYTKAGENLAYGFPTSNETINGWMNSPSHRDNMLSTAYLEVGFGFANSPNFQEKGQQTVVVAMYGSQVQGVTTQAQVPAPTAVAPAATKSAPTPPPPVNTEQPVPTPAKESISKPESEQPVTATPELASMPVNEPKQKDISRAQLISEGKAGWSGIAITALVGILALVFVIKHGINIRRLLNKSEKFILHHPLIDAAIIVLVVLGILITRSVGFIR